MFLTSNTNRSGLMNTLFPKANLEYLYLQLPPAEILSERAARRVYFVGMLFTALLPVLCMYLFL